jgi:hypothetical protein
MKEFGRFKLGDMDIIANMHGDLIENFNIRYKKNLDDWVVGSAVIAMSEYWEDAEAEDIVFVDDEMDLVIFAIYSKEGNNAIVTIKGLIPEKNVFINKGFFSTTLEDLIKGDFDDSTR